MREDDVLVQHMEETLQHGHWKKNDVAFFKTPLYGYIGCRIHELDRGPGNETMAFIELGNGFIWVLVSSLFRQIPKE